MTEKIPYFDAHCDTLHALCSENGFGDLRENCGHLDLLRGSSFAPRAQIFALFARGEEKHIMYRRMLDRFFCETERHSELVSFCRSGGDADRAFSEGKTAAFLSVESAELLDCSLEHLEEAAALGVRAVNITWNYENALSGSNAEGSDKGLTPAGRAFVRRCGRLGVAVDVSHISDPGFWDVLECAEGPVIASHSNLRALCAHPRNLTDGMFRALCDYGGVAGLNLYARFLGASPDPDTVRRHFDRFLELGGEDHIGIGSDFDGMDELPAGIRGVQDISVLWETLLRSGYDETLLRKVFFGNFMRIFM